MRLTGTAIMAISLIIACLGGPIGIAIGIIGIYMASKWDSEEDDWFGADQMRREIEAKKREQKYRHDEKTDDDRRG